MQGVVDLEGGHRQVDRERQPRIGRHRALGQGIEDHDELRPAAGLDLEAGRPGMAAVAQEDRPAGLERRPEIEPPVAPARGPDHVAEIRSDDRRPAVVLDQLRRHQADDPDRPRAADDRGMAPHGIRGGRRRCAGRCLRRRLVSVTVSRSPSSVGATTPAIAARASLMAWLVRSRRVLFAVSSSVARRSASARSSVSSRAAAAADSPTRPAALIRGATANDSVSTSTASGATPAEARSAAIPGRGPAAIRASPRRTIARVLAEDRHEVRDAPDRREVREGQGGGRSTGLVGQEELGQLERDAAAGEARLRVDAVGALRVDDRDGHGQHGRQRGGGRSRSRRSRRRARPRSRRRWSIRSPRSRSGSRRPPVPRRSPSTDRPWPSSSRLGTYGSGVDAPGDAAPGRGSPGRSARPRRSRRRP